MKHIITAASVAAFLVACGGGGGSDSTTASSATTSTVAPAVQVPETSTTAQVVSGPDITISGTAKDYLVQSTGAPNVVVSGSMNTVTFAANQAAGVVQISGTGNTVIFRAGTTVQSLAVPGSGNTVYVPEGSTVAISGATTATVKTYKP